MALMMLIMILPVIGLGLFYIWPLAWALPAYLVLVAFSGFFHALMRKSMTLPVATGPKELIGLPVIVLTWEDGSGQVRVHGEIWRASSRDGRVVKEREELFVTGVEGLTLIVEPRPKTQPAEDERTRGTKRTASNVSPVALR